MRKITLLFAALIISGVTFAQTIVPVATGFLRPAGICKDYNGHLIVAESGTGMNDGRVSMLDTMGIRQTIIHGLPSYMDTMSGEISGPWRTYVMMDSMLMVLTGKGPDTLGGVDSLAGSILLFDMTGFMPGSDSMDASDVVKAISIQKWVLNNGFMDSNPFSMHHDTMSNIIYVTDAGANAVLKIDSAANISVMDTFPAVPHPHGGFPPFIEYVPTDIIAGPTGELYMCNLTGFSFVPGIAEIVMLDTAGFSHSTQVSGLSLAVDMEMDMDSMNSIYVLQFANFDTATFTPMNGTASIVRAMMNGTIDTIATGFGPSAGMTMDWSNGFYVTEIGSGTVLHITDIQISVPVISNPLFNSLSVYPNPFENSIKINYMLNETSNVNYSIADQLGKVVFTKDAGDLKKGEQTFEINSKQFDISSLKSGVYYLTVQSGTSRQTVSIIKE